MCKPSLPPWNGVLGRRVWSTRAGAEVGLDCPQPLLGHANPLENPYRFVVLVVLLGSPEVKPQAANLCVNDPELPIAPISDGADVVPVHLIAQRVPAAICFGEVDDLGLGSARPRFANTSTRTEI